MWPGSELGAGTSTSMQLRRMGSLSLATGAVTLKET